MQASPRQPFRQIHLDFHTSPAIDGVGADFDAESFARVLQAARVESIQVFARCWHGWMYYESKKFPESVHPGLVRKNLLGEQMEVLRRHGIRPVIYTSGQVDRRLLEKRPDWAQVRLDGDGHPVPSRVFEAAWGDGMCLNSPYRDYVLEHVVELLELLEVDGFWLDAASPQDCACLRCRKDMLARGLDPQNERERLTFGVEMLEAFLSDFSERVRRAQPKATVFFNRGHLHQLERRTGKHFSHFEIESLGSCPGWGYMHYPASVRYARTLGKELVAMTGKFHTGWGDFHSYKNPVALEFECFQALAHGAKVSVGDQLHPRGVLCEHTYRMIGDVFAQIEAKEPWCRDAQPVVDSAIITTEPLIKGSDGDAAYEHPREVTGATRMLQELGMQFNIADPLDAVENYDLLILPDALGVDSELEAKLRAFLARGGKLLATGTSGLNNARFAEEVLGLNHLGPSEFENDFLIPEGRLAEGLAKVEYGMYDGAERVEPLTGTDILASAHTPYFPRDWKHFCSHRHAPSDRGEPRPVVFRNGRVVTFSHRVFRAYRSHAPVWIKRLIYNALTKELDHTPLLRHDGPSTLIATLMRQASEARDVVHLMHYIPERRAEFDIVEDAIPLHELTLTVKARGVASVRLVPQGLDLAFRTEGEFVSFTIPKMQGHQMVEISFSTRSQPD